MSPRASSLLALMLLVPAPSAGVILAMHVIPGPVGQAAFAASKLWILALPLVWTVLVDRTPLTLPRVRRIGLLTGLGLGVAIGVGILAAYALLGIRWIDAAWMRDRLSEIGLGDPRVYLAGAVYWCIVTALLEEYVWRWFVFRKCEVLVAPIPAVVLSALFFTVHHVLALGAFADARVTAIASAGVFLGGAIWSGCYLRYRSIWPGYVSHVVVDVAVFAIGGWILFGGAG